jgi:hypothetical protein
MTSKKKLAPKQYIKQKLEKQRRRKQKEEREVEITTVPRSIVLNRGKSTPFALKQLVFDFRKVMLPFTALKLQASRGNKLKTVIDFAQEIYVTHLIVFNANVKNTKFKYVNFASHLNNHSELLVFPTVLLWNLYFMITLLLMMSENTLKVR